MGIKKLFFIMLFCVSCGTVEDELTCTLMGCENDPATVVVGPQGPPGQDGKDGVDGEDGENGEDGQSCYATPTEGGATVTCGEFVVFIPAGEDGADGEDGQACFLEKAEKGVYIVCGDDRAYLPIKEKGKGH